MSSKLDIWTALLSTLQAAQATGQPLAFVANVFDGVYPDINDTPINSYPAIVMEPDEDDEKFFTTGMSPALLSDFRIYLSCMLSEGSFNKGISGDTSQDPRVVGLLEFVDLVKGVIQRDMTLGGVPGLQKIAFPKAKFFFESYPIRECKIEIIFSSQLTTQTH